MSPPEGLAEWSAEALGVLEGFPAVFQRTSGKGTSRAAFIASADELQAMAQDARRWSESHPSPLPAADRHFKAMIDALENAPTVIFRAQAERSPGGPVQKRIAELVKTFTRHGEKLEEICQRGY